MSTRATTADETTRAVLTDLLRHCAAADFDAIAALFADQVDWLVNWPEDEHGTAVATPWIKQRSTKADAVDNFRSLVDFHVPETSTAVVERMLVDGEDAVVFGELRQTARPTGRSYRARFALHVTVSGGLIVRYHIYEDSLSIKRAFAPAAAGAVG